MTIQINDKVMYPDWTGLKTKEGLVIDIGSNNAGRIYYTLDNGDQLDDWSFTNDGAKVI